MLLAVPCVPVRFAANRMCKGWTQYTRTRETDTCMRDGLTASAAVCTPLSYVRLRQNVAAQAPGRRADLDV